jgi:hypothetical protein
MSADVWEKLLLLIAGGGLTVLGAWLNDWRREYYQSRLKLKDAYSAWLTSRSDVLGRVKKLSRLARTEPSDIEHHNALMFQFIESETELKQLLTWLHTALMNERKRNVRMLLHSSSRIAELVVERLGIILTAR